MNDLMWQSCSVMLSVCWQLLVKVIAEQHPFMYLISASV